MKEVGNWIIRVILKAILLGTFAVIGICVFNSIRDDIQFKREMKEQSERWMKEGISPVTRSGKHQDTTKIRIDTIKK